MGHTSNSTVGNGIAPASPSDDKQVLAHVDLKRAYNNFCRVLPSLILLPAAAVVLVHASKWYNSGNVANLLNTAKDTHFALDLLTVCCALLLAVGCVILFMWFSSRPVYLLDFSLRKPPDSWKSPHEDFIIATETCKKFNEDNVAFQIKILNRSGLGENTYLPPVCQSLLGERKGYPKKLDPTMDHARAEFEAVVFPAVEAVLKKTGLSPKDIGVLVVNCSLFNPTPSLSAMVINHFGMRSNIISYSLGGMGCSAGLIAIDLARQMLQLYPSTYALVVSTENITHNWYSGNEKSMLLPNCIFRAGGVAVVLSNHWADSWRAKYRLQHVVRTHMGATEDGYKCVFQREDEAGIVGVSLAKELMAVAGEALKVNLTTLAPRVLPISEQLLFAINMVSRIIGRSIGYKVKPYIPDFQQAFQHVIIHPGGRAVIDAIQQQLSLTTKTAEPSRATLYRYGNTSSASIWYALGYIEHHLGVRRGDKVWQLAFGSGFKCNSSVWQACRSFRVDHEAWEDVTREHCLQKIKELQGPRPPRPAEVSGAPQIAAK